MPPRASVSEWPRSHSSRLVARRARHRPSLEGTAIGSGWTAANYYVLPPCAQVIIPIYLVRTALMNSTGPLQQSVLMDFVPKKSRGKWNSAASISSFGWCGSAALGGMLVDRCALWYPPAFRALPLSPSTVLTTFAMSPVALFPF